MDRGSTTPAHRPAQPEVSRNGLREQVSQRVMTAIFEERFKSGQRLIVQRLAELYGVSPTPVREALVELAGFSMVELLPNRGAVVKPFGPRELNDMSQVRRVLEAEATRCAAGRIDEAALAELRTELRELHSLSFDEHRDHLARQADNRLHELIAASCGNVRLAGEIRRYLSLFRVLRNVSHLRDAGDDYRHSDDVPEHLAIVEALWAVRADDAAAAMESHLRSVQATLAEVMFSKPPIKPAKRKSKPKRNQPFT